MLSKVGDGAFKEKIAHFEDLLASDGSLLLTPDKDTNRERHPHILAAG